MLKELKDATNKTFTENGAVTLKSSLNDCVDLFGTIGALRGADEEAVTRFQRAWTEDRDMAMKILFYARDVRGGLGERQTFRAILKWLADEQPKTVVKNLPYIAKYGRWDDLLCLLDTPVEDDVIELIKKQLQKDVREVGSGKVSLLAKWLPSENATAVETRKAARKIIGKLSWTAMMYRHITVALRKEISIIENNLREKDYSFDYANVPSRAMLKYRKAFDRNDGLRYGEYLEAVREGKAKINTGTLYPYDIVHRIIKDDDVNDRAALDTMWQKLADTLCADTENALAVVDGSWSMHCGGSESMSPIEVAISLGIYFAEHCKGEFANHFITFSENPQLIEIKGKDIYEKVQHVISYDECANTDIHAVFELLLNTAIKHKMPQEEMPKRLYVISDMEWDCMTENADETNFEHAKRIFEEAGYKLPEIVFWNVDSRNQQQPVTAGENGVALVSGASPRIFSMVMSGETNPYNFMVETLKAYDEIAA